MIITLALGVHFWSVHELSLMRAFFVESQYRIYHILFWEIRYPNGHMAGRRDT